MKLVIFNLLLCLVFTSCRFGTTSIEIVNDSDECIDSAVIDVQNYHTIVRNIQPHSSHYLSISLDSIRNNLPEIMIRATLHMQSGPDILIHSYNDLPFASLPDHNIIRLDKDCQLRIRDNFGSYDIVP